MSEPAGMTSPATLLKQMRAVGEHVDAGDWEAAIAAQNDCDRALRRAEERLGERAVLEELLRLNQAALARVEQYRRERIEQEASSRREADALAQYLST